MNAREKSRIEAIVRVALFGPSHAEDWTPVPPAPATKAQAKAIDLFSQLNAEKTGIVARIERFSVGQVAGTGDFHGGATSKGVLRNGLRSDLADWNEAAGTIADVQGKPEIMDGFRRPYGSDELLKTTALAFAKNAEPLEDAFIELGFDEDFIAKLKERVRLFGEANEDKDEGLQGQVGSGDGLEKAIEDGLLVLKQLNVLMKNLYKADAASMGEWLTAAHIERVWTSGKKKKPPETGTTPPV